jgi:hypothetical protein
LRQNRVYNGDGAIGVFFCAAYFFVKIAAYPVKLPSAPLDRFIVGFFVPIKLKIQPVYRLLSQKFVIMHKNPMKYSCKLRIAKRDVIDYTVGTLYDNNELCSTL